MLLAAACAVGAIVTAGALLPSDGFLIWNRTESAPKGLYWRARAAALDHGDWAIVSGDSPAARWIAEQRFLAHGWPIIKRIAGVPGDEICRDGLHVSVNGIGVATAFKADSMGRVLPEWSGCATLQEGEFFLLNNHPRSLDGRYFGAASADDIEGEARLLWSVP